MKSGCLWKPSVITAMVAETGSSYSKQAWRGVRNGKFWSRVSEAPASVYKVDSDWGRYPDSTLASTHLWTSIHMCKNATPIRRKHRTQVKNPANSDLKKVVLFHPLYICTKWDQKKKNLSLGGRNTHMHIHTHLYIYEVKNLSMWEGT